MGRHALQKEQKSLNKNDTRAQVRHLYIVQQLKILQLYGHNIDLTENICTKKKPECNWHHRMHCLQAGFVIGNLYPDIKKNGLDNG